MTETEIQAVQRAGQEPGSVAHLAQVEKVEQIALAFIQPSPDNFRRETGDVSGLAATIKAQGILQPLTVSPPDEAGMHTIHFGERRYHAAKLAGLVEVPAVIRQFGSDAERLEAGLIENLAREDISEVDEAHAYNKLIEVGGYSQRQLAKRLGCSQAHISRRLALLELPEPAIKALDTGSITIEDAVELSRVTEPEAVEALIERAGGGKADMRQAIAQHERHRETEAKREKAVAELVKKGIPILEEAGEKHRWLANQSQWQQVIQITPSEHRREPCHAAVVSDWGNVSYLCTDPKRHSKKGASKVKTPLASRSEEELEAQRRERAHKKARLEANERRVTFLTELLSKSKLGAGEAWALYMAALPQLRQPADVEKVACQLLGIEPIERSWYQDYAGALAKYSAESGQNAVRAGLGFALAIIELAIGGEFAEYKHAGAHFEYLARKGYTLSEVEQAELAKHAQMPAEAEPVGQTGEPTEASADQVPDVVDGDVIAEGDNEPVGSGTAAEGGEAEAQPAE